MGSSKLNEKGNTEKKVINFLAQASLKSEIKNM